MIDTQKIKELMKERNANKEKAATNVGVGITIPTKTTEPKTAPAGGVAMASMDLGFNLNEPKSFDNFPEGEYTAKIVNAEFKFTSMNKPMVTTQFQILDGEYANKYHWDNNILKNKDNKPNTFAIDRVQEDIQLVTGEIWKESTVPALKNHLSKMIGKIVVIKVVHKTVEEKVFISTYINSVKEVA